MKIIDRFPRPVRAVENVWIGLSDGCRLAARIWLPEDAETDPVPAILECLPYRKRDGTVWRDAEMQPYLAGHGYAVLRIDLRGSGDSDGVLTDEYTTQEQNDCAEAIAWAAAQSWCTGAVGMWGISWGGFNALQVAARRPPALKAIITIMAADDRYADDVHYMGGCLLHDNFAWASAMYAYLSLPPDPLIVGPGWRATWLRRLDHAGFWLRQWLSHQRRDSYWRQGSVCEDYGRIHCAVYAMGGWEDGYSNAVPRLLAGLIAPSKGLIGPWGHAHPYHAFPGPSIGFLQECLRWWGHWLKGRDDGMMNEPRYRVWMNDSFRPAPFAQTRPGRWVAEPRWPSHGIVAHRLYLCDRRLGPEPGMATALRHRSPQHTGLGALEWCSYGTAAADLPIDQRSDDGGSICFDSESLPRRLEILGAAIAHLDVSVDRRQASLAVRLCDVAPDGASTRVTYSLFNLSHRDGCDNANPAVPGERYRIAVPLNHVAHSFLTGHRIRLAISTCYWPQMWPSPEPATLTLMTGSGYLDLPVRLPRPDDCDLVRFPEPESARPVVSEEIRPAATRRTVRRDVGTGETVVVMIKDGGSHRLTDIDLESDSCAFETYRIRGDDPLSAEGEIVYRQRLRRGAWRIRVESRTTIRASADRFHLTAQLDAFEGDRRVRALNERFGIARDLV